MNNEIKVYPEILKVHLAYDNGWQEGVGYKVVIQGLEFSFVLEDDSEPLIRVSSLDSGTLIDKISIRSTFLYLSADNKILLNMLEEKAKVINRSISRLGKDYIINCVNRQKKSYQKEFGETPPIESYDLGGSEE